MRLTTVVLVCALAAVLLYAAACALLYFKQDDLLFYKVRNDPELAERWRQKRVTIQAGDAAIEGWWAENRDATNDLTVLYFGGNAEDVLYMLGTANRLHVRKVLATNYRGYGDSQGEPSGENLFEDALAIYDYAVAQPGSSARNIVVMGRSLGSGVATYLAANRNVRAAILVTPYDSIAAIAQAQFPFFPASWLLKNRFPSAEFAKSIHTPALLVAAEKDTVIPAIHTQRLFAAWAGPKQSITISGAGHNDVEAGDAYYESINRFLDAAL